MVNLQTIIDDDALSEWCERLPDCREFLENFFLTCGPFTRETNLINYARDVAGYSEIYPSWMKYQSELMTAFDDIARDVREFD